VKLAPFNFTKISVGLYRNTTSPPLEAAVQGELLRELHRDYPSLTQIPNGVLFADPAKGRTLFIDQSHIETAASGAHVAVSVIDQMQSELRTVVPIVVYGPPYRVRVEGTGTVQALEGVNPTDVLRSYAPPEPSWDAIGGRCTHTCVRYLFTADDGTQRDVHVEPLFAQPDKFYVMVVSFNGGQGVASLDDAMQQAHDEVGVIERLSNRIVADIVER
jgi:hypothetical protein